MSQPSLNSKKLYGTATVGTKGQVVIPADAREEMHIQPGDRLYVVGSPDGGFLGFLKEDALESVVAHLTAQVENFRALKENDKENEQTKE
jgi:AbrB family looped-hinge helix DNA binding protein